MPGRSRHSTSVGAESLTTSRHRQGEPSERPARVGPCLLGARRTRAWRALWITRRHLPDDDECGRSATRPHHALPEDHFGYPGALEHAEGGGPPPPVPAGNGDALAFGDVLHSSPEALDRNAKASVH